MDGFMVGISFVLVVLLFWPNQANFCISNNFIILGCIFGLKNNSKINLILDHREPFWNDREYTYLVESSINVMK